MIVRPLLYVAAAAVLLAGTGFGWSQDGRRMAPRSAALLAAIDGPIGPAMERHVRNVVDEAGARDAAALVLRINTPGGLVTTMRTIVSIIVDSPVPVIGYVAPSGAHAASAGTFILYATHIAAMAPGTNVGAATPVRMGGFPGTPSPGERRPGDGKDDGNGSERGSPPSSDAAMAKAVNDAVAFIRSLAELRNRNADWAEKAVRQGASIAARAAVDLQVIELMARDVDELLAAIDGRTVTVAGQERVLSTRGASVERVEPDFMSRALGVLSNPNVALILLMIGVYGLIFEFLTPGAIGPGVVGFICLVLGLYALNQLPLNYAGLALILVGIAFMVAEALTPTFGILGLGGVAAFVIGSAMLVDTDVPAYRLSWWTIGAVAAVSGGILVFLVGYLWRVYRRPRTGSSGRVVGSEARVLDWGNGEGHVWVAGERWRARGESGLNAGAAVKVREMDGLTLVVAQNAGSDAEPTSPHDEKG